MGAFRVGLAVVTQITYFADNQLLRPPDTAGFCVKEHSLRWLAIAVLSLIEPFKPIRFIRIFSSRIGHCAADVDLFLRRLELKPTRAKLIYFALHDEPVANYALLNVWRGMLPVIHRGRIGKLWQAIFLKLKGTKFVIELCPSGQEYRAWHVPSLVRKPRPLIEDPYVLFHARDSEYLRVVQPGRDYSHNDFRNCDIDACLPAADYITQRGFIAVRAGRFVEKRIETQNPRIFDYHEYHEEPHDLRLAAHCHFYIGPNNGTAQLPLLYDRPIAYTNSVPFWMLNWGKNCLFIPKLAKPKRENRLLTFNELQELGAFDHTKRQGIHTKWYELHGIELIENSASDILDLAKDMFDQIEFKPEPNELQLEYKNMFFSSQHEREFAPNIGPRFIEKYQALIG